MGPNGNITSLRNNGTGTLRTDGGVCVTDIYGICR